MDFIVTTQLIPKQIIRRYISSKVLPKNIDKENRKRYNQSRAFSQMLVLILCYCGSMAEHLTRNEKVVSSILTSSSKKPCGKPQGFLIYVSGLLKAVYLSRHYLNYRYSSPQRYFLFSRSLSISQFRHSPLWAHIVPLQSGQLHFFSSFWRNASMPCSLMKVKFSIMLMRYFVL